MSRALALDLIGADDFAGRRPRPGYGHGDRHGARLQSLRARPGDAMTTSEDPLQCRSPFAHDCPDARAQGAPAAVAPAPERTQPHIERLSHGGIEWIHIEEPSALERAWLAEHFEFHALDLEDVMSRNQRPKIDEYPDYLFIVLHFPIFDKQVGRLNAGELDLFVGPDFIITLPNQPLKPVAVPVRALPHERGDPRAALLQGDRLPALPDRRPVGRLLLPDAAQDREQARAARGGDLRRPRRGDRARHLQREAGDHQLPQDHPARSARCCATSSARSSATCARSWRSTSTTSSTPPSGSGTCSRTTRRSSRRSTTRTSP